MEGGPHGTPTYVAKVASSMCLEFERILSGQEKELRQNDDAVKLKAVRKYLVSCERFSVVFGFRFAPLKLVHIKFDIRS